MMKKTPDKSPVEQMREWLQQTFNNWEGLPRKDEHGYGVTQGLQMVLKKLIELFPEVQQVPIEDKVNWGELHKRWDMHWGGLDKSEHIFKWWKAKLQYNVVNHKEQSNAATLKWSDADILNARIDAIERYSENVFLKLGKKKEAEEWLANYKKNKALDKEDRL